MTTAEQTAKAAQFAQLHASGCFVLPNAWDMVSALLCLDIGYPAVATTSWGVAFAHGVRDGERLGRARMLEVAGAVARRLPVPVTADLEAGYGAAPQDVATTVIEAIAAGLIGCNLEDRDHASGKLLDRQLAVDRIRAAREAAVTAGLSDFVINARTDPFYVGMEKEAAAREAIDRSNLYLEAGASCAFVPGRDDAETAGMLARHIGGPLNIMANGHGASSVHELSAAGVRRISLGAVLVAAAYGEARRLLDEIKRSGSFESAQPRPGQGFGNVLLLFKEEQ